MRRERQRSGEAQANHPEMSITAPVTDKGQHDSLLA